MELNDYLRLAYPVRVTTDEEGDWIAEIEALEGCVADGATPQEAIERVMELKREWLEAAIRVGKRIPIPEQEDILPSGKWLQRVPRSLHRTLVRLAKLERTSLNALVTSILSEYAGGTRRVPESTPSSVSAKARMIGAYWFTGYPTATTAANETLQSLLARVVKVVGNVERGKPETERVG